LKFIDKLDAATKNNNSLLCVGLDINLNSLPQPLLNQDDPIFLFASQIIKATQDLVCAYKPNMAFFEKYGIYGLESLIKIIELIKTETNVPVILDAKRGDIGHSSAAYAESVFKVFKADAVTVNPYLGFDSVEPFLEYRDKGIFILCLTSNPGARDFQLKGQKDPLYQAVAQKAKQWNRFGNCGLVAGATNPNELAKIRELVGNMLILIPGIGAQGGELKATVAAGLGPENARVIINSSRNILYASKNDDFAQAARSAAKKLRDEINAYRSR